MMEHQILADGFSSEVCKVRSWAMLVTLKLNQDQLCGNIQQLAGALTAEQWEDIKAKIDKEFGL